MKNIIVVVADGNVAAVFTNIDEEVEHETIDFDFCFDSRDEQEALEDYVDSLRATMREI